MAGIRPALGSAARRLQTGPRPDALRKFHILLPGTHDVLELSEEKDAYAH